MDNDKLKDIDLNILCKELDYLSKIKCSECENPECSNMSFGTSYCCQLLLHACKYLDDDDDLKKLIEGCFDDNLACIDCKLDGKHKSCTVYMMTQAYERLATWRIN